MVGLGHVLFAAAWIGLVVVLAKLGAERFLPWAEDFVGLPLLLIGVSQLLYAVPMVLRYRRQGRLRRAKGAVIMASLTFLLNGSCMAVGAPKLIVLIRHSQEGANRGTLGSIRSEISLAYEKQGRYPADLTAFKPLKLWNSRWAGYPHPASAAVELYAGRENRDSGRWAYVNNPKSPHGGDFYIDCTHTDMGGTAWSEY